MNIGKIMRYISIFILCFLKGSNEAIGLRSLHVVQSAMDFVLFALDTREFTGRTIVTTALFPCLSSSVRHLLYLGIWNVKKVEGIFLVKIKGHHVYV